MKLKQFTTISSWENISGYPSQSFPSVTVTSTGRIIAAWRNAPTKEQVLDNRLLISCSDDNGKTWSKPRIPCRPQKLDGKDGVFRMGSVSCLGERVLMLICRVDTSRPERPFYNESNQGLLDCTVFLSISDDNGDTWSEPRQLDTAPYNHQPTPTTGPVLVLPDGRIAIQFELNKPFDSPEPWRHLPVLKFSDDQAQTFTHTAVAAADADNNIFYWDQRPLVLRSGKLVDFFWTWDNAKSIYHNLSRTCSEDGGKSWSAVHDTGIPGQPGVSAELADGRIAVPVVDRTSNPKVLLRVTEDQGLSFIPETLQLSGHLKKQTDKQANVNGAWREMTAFSLGLPAAALSPNNTVYVVWYEGEATDQTNIQFAEVEL